MNFIKKQKENMLFLTIASLYVLIFMINYSPFFPEGIMELGESSIESIVIGKYLFCGIVPYKDLFGTGGPLAILINAISWISQIRIGGMLIQICILFLILTGTSLLLKEHCSDKIAIILTCLSTFFWFAVFSSGNTESALALNVVIWGLVICEKIQLKGKTKNFLLGLLLSLALLTNLNTVIIILMLIMGYYLDHKMHIKHFLFCIGGFCAVIIPFLLYFFINHGLSELLEVYIINAQMLLDGFSTSNEVLRKIIKCIPILFYLIIAVTLKRSDIIHYSYLHIFSAIGMFSGVFFSNVTWEKCGFVYLSLLISIALIFEDKKKNSLILACSACLICIFIFVIPVKNYIINYKDYYLTKAYQEENEFLKRWISQNGSDLNCEIIMVDLPARYYLLIDKKPAYRYFNRQTKLCAYNKDISSGILNYIESSAIPWMFVNGKGWIEEHICQYNLYDYWNLNSSIAVYRLSGID